MIKKSKPPLKNTDSQNKVLMLKNKTAFTLTVRTIGRVLPSSLTEKHPALLVLPLILLDILIVFIGYLLEITLGDINSVKDLILPTIVFATFIVTAFFIAYLCNQALFNDTSSHIVKNIKDTKSLQALTEWLDKSWSFKSANAYILMFAFIYGLIASALLSFTRQSFVGLGFLFINLCASFFVGLAMYSVLWVVLFTYRLRNYHYDLNTFSPGDSEVVSRISSIINRQLFMFASVFAALTLIASAGIFDKNVVLGIQLPMAILCWVILTIGFIVLRTTINHIVQEALWRILKKIQAQINLIETTQDLSDKETSEKIMRLNDLYQKVHKSRIKTIDIKSLSTFFSQLMLPMLGLIVGNIDKIRILFP